MCVQRHNQFVEFLISSMAWPVWICEAKRPFNKLITHEMEMKTESERKRDRILIRTQFNSSVWYPSARRNLSKYTAHSFLSALSNERISTRFLALSMSSAHFSSICECDTTTFTHDMGIEPYNMKEHVLFFTFFPSFRRQTAYLSRIQFTSFAYD